MFFYSFISHVAVEAIYKRKLFFQEGSDSKGSSGTGRKKEKGISYDASKTKRSLLQFDSIRE
ncbi:hypothetical protein B0I21_1014 [Sphingobacterium paludis]|uniref:Uncharacterized protein n=1 Tax=Sphingobacterium paludis TaxID=1476465 RepID=A0A4R7D7I8_9SPHI|nr:hypothetical protein B0I21_1014 [Sphingobacterium paludis]